MLDDLDGDAEGICVRLDEGIVNEARLADDGGEQDVGSAAKGCDLVEGIGVNELGVVELDGRFGCEHTARGFEKAQGVTFACDDSGANSFE